MLHTNVLLGDRHPIHNWSVANATERNALVVTTADIGRICLQQNIITFFILTSVVPNIRWIKIEDPTTLQPLSSRLSTIANSSFVGKTGHTFTVNTTEDGLILSPSGAGGSTLIPIAVDTTYVIDPAGGGNFLTLQAAWDYLRATHSIDANATVTLRLVDGVHDVNSTISLLDYVWGGQVVITGTTVNSYSISSVVSSGSSGAYTYVFTLPSTVGIVIGDIINVFNPSGGTNPHLTAGAWKVTAVTATSVTVTSIHVIASTPTGAITSSHVYVCKTKLVSTTGALGVYSRVKDITKLQFERAGTRADIGLLLGTTSFPNILTTMDNLTTLLSVYNYSIGVSVTTVQRMTIHNLAVGYSSTGIQISLGRAVFRALSINDSINNGISILHMGIGDIQPAASFLSIIQGSTLDGILVYEGGILVAAATVSSFNNLSGMWLPRLGSMYTASCITNNNTTHGINIAGASTALVTTPTYVSNGVAATRTEVGSVLVAS